MLLALKASSKWADPVKITVLLYCFLLEVLVLANSYSSSPRE